MHEYVRTSAIDCTPKLPGHGLVKGKRPAVSQGCQTDRSTQTSSSLASIKVRDWKIAVG